MSFVKCGYPVACQPLTSTGLVRHTDRNQSHGFLYAHSFIYIRMIEAMFTPVSDTSGPIAFMTGTCVVPATLEDDRVHHDT